MVDSWPVDLANGFEVVSANYANIGNIGTPAQKDYLGKNGQLEHVGTLVGNEGGASYNVSTKRLEVIFQGLSSYWPRVGDPQGPESKCVSS